MCSRLRRLAPELEGGRRDEPRPIKALAGNLSSDRCMLTDFINMRFAASALVPAGRFLGRADGDRRIPAVSVAAPIDAS